MSTRSVPWWLVGGTEQCPFCLQSYAVEVEVRCAGCDRGFCAHCLARVEARAGLYVRLGEEVEEVEEVEAVEEVWCLECGAEEVEV